MKCRYCKEPVGDERNCDGCGARVSAVVSRAGETWDRERLLERILVDRPKKQHPLLKLIESCVNDPLSFLL